MSSGPEARRFLRRCRHGALSTLSRRFDGHPYGSAVPFVLDQAVRPVILVSRLAEHTRNLEADRRVSLLVQEPDGDVQADGRLTLVGEARPGTDMALARYLAYAPGAERQLGLGDFSFWTIVPRTLRFIGGFAEIRWISVGDYAPPPDGLAVDEQGIVSRMNLELAAAVQACCRLRHGRDCEAAAAIGVDCDGLDARCGTAIVRVDFPGSVADEASAREALAALARQAGAA